VGALEGSRAAEAALTTAEVLAALRAHRGDEIVLATMTALVGWGAAPLGAWDLPVVGAMGSASSVGLGLALARPERRVWVLDGDGSLLMQLGTLATIGAAAPANFVHLVIANGVYAFTGGQRLPRAPRADLAAAARALGYPTAATIADAAGLAGALPGLLRAEGPVFVELAVRAPAERGFDASGLPAMAERGGALRAQFVGENAV